MHPPSIGRRFLALLVDWVVAALTAGLFTGVGYPPADPVENLVITGFFVAEVGLLTGLLGFSIGKRLLGMRVEGPDGRPIGVPRALLRTALIVLVIPPAVMNAERRGLHDVASGSRQVRVAADD